MYFILILKFLEEKVKMKTRKLLTIALVITMIFSLNMVVSAKAAGPFGSNAPDGVGNHMEFEDFYEDGGLTAWDALQPALDGRNFLANPEFVDGAEGFGDEEFGEWAWNTLVMSWHKDDSVGDMRSSKFCGNEGNFPFFVEWKYDQAYIADSFLIGTGNDCTNYPRRMDDGWTFSGSNDGSNWTVLYTGQGSDYDPITFTWWRFDLPNNTEAFQYYRLYAEDRYHDQEQGIIQLSVVAVTGNVPGAAVEIEEELGVGGGDEADLPAPAPAQAAPAPAPSTFDPISLIAFGALISATGILAAKKSKK